MRMHDSLSHVVDIDRNIPNTNYKITVIRSYLYTAEGIYLQKRRNGELPKELFFLEINSRSSEYVLVCHTVP